MFKIKFEAVVNQVPVTKPVRDNCFKKFAITKMEMPVIWTCD